MKREKNEKRIVKTNAQFAFNKIAKLDENEKLEEFLTNFPPSRYYPNLHWITVMGRSFYNFCLLFNLLFFFFIIFYYFHLFIYFTKFYLFILLNSLIK